MKTKLTQKERIKRRLLESGYITRNQCLSVFPAITRCAAYIGELTQEGWSFETKEENGDYIYKITHCPLKRTVYTVEGGKTLETYSK